MKQYIDKSALLSEIDRQNIGYNVDGKHSVEYNTTRKILNIIDTLEVKDVDLEKETNECFNKVFSAFGFDKNSIIPMNYREIRAFAKHFFELGTKTLKGE